MHGCSWTFAQLTRTLTRLFTFTPRVRPQRPGRCAACDFADSSLLSCLPGLEALCWTQFPAAAGRSRVSGQLYTTNLQNTAAVSLAANGDFVVVWRSTGSSGGDASGGSIQGQRYASSGAAQGGQFQVNTYTTNAQYYPAVSLAADGGFVAAWQSDGSSGGDSINFSIQGQRYASGGAAQGGQFQVNTYTTSSQSLPAVSLAADGAFVVVWHSNGSSGGDISANSIQGQRYSSGGAAQGAQFQVNSYTTLGQYAPSVSLDADGDFVVVWYSNGSSGGDTSSYSIQSQRYASGGAALGGQFQVNAFTTFSQDRPAVSLAADGDFVVVWQSNGSSGGDTSGRSIQGQRYASVGTAQGGQFQANAYTANEQLFQAVSLDRDGDFVVVWQSYGSSGGDSSSWSIQGQRYASDGVAQGGQFQVNSYTTDGQTSAAISVDADGDFVVVWESYGSSGSDSSSGSIQGQRYRVTGDLQGKVFFDQDFDGLQDVAEPGIPGVTVELYDEALKVPKGPLRPTPVATTS